ncbi:MAG: MazG family protein [Candidatus Nanopelagicales bacterium]
MAESSDGLSELVAVMDRLRSPGGCPWDARQTHRSLAEYLLEEAYETVEAIESGDRDDLREELGDLLLQVVFHARIAQEDADDPWDIDDVARGIIAKLVRRHPHVFSDDGDAVTTADDVESRWHALKAQEKGRASVTEGIPEALPALLRASKVLARSEHLDIPLPEAVDLAADIDDEEALGDLLLVLVAAGRARGWDAEAALREAVRRQARRIRDAEGA